MTRQRIIVSCRIAIIAVALWCLPFRDCRATETSFERDVRPILKAHCWHCHGEEPELKGGLDARLVRSILKGGDSGAAVVAGDHSASLIYQRIASGEMPPGEKKVSSDELRMLAEWIDAGAKTIRPEPESLPAGDIVTEEDRQHWSFQPIDAPSIPVVKHTELVRSPIDAFLLAKLRKRDSALVRKRIVKR